MNMTVEACKLKIELDLELSPGAPHNGVSNFNAEILLFICMMYTLFFFKATWDCFNSFMKAALAKSERCLVLKTFILKIIQLLSKY